MTQYRKLAGQTEGVAASDGAGVKMRRLIGHHTVEALDPFLMLDHFHSDNPDDYIAGFPSHPHRGFETVTYMMAGRMRHKDNKGHEGVIEPGGVQWMTAAGGIVHSEMPEQEDGLMSGFQLWINLPRDEKMKPAGYQEFSPDHIPVDSREGAELRVVTGTTSRGVSGPVTDVATDPFFAEIRLQPNATLEESLPEGHTVMLAVYDGQIVTEGEKGDEAIAKGRLGVFGPGQAVKLTAGAEGATALLIAGKPIGEPVAWGGPFVMNSEGEVRQAALDFQQGRF